jgi:uncharacterized membrane-anchored protein
MKTSGFSPATILSKVPEATALFWVTKVLTTGMGETASDWLARRLDPPVAVALAGIVLCIALLVQFRSRRYVPWIYWLAVVMVSVFGTMVADVLHVGLGIPYIASTVFFAATLATIFSLWHRSERTLSIHSITTSRRELFYWASILATFALGTAAGDLTAVNLHLGYFSSGILFAALITIPAIGYWKFGWGEIAAFWFAYVVTRPLGASFADWAGVSHVRGGLGLGTGTVSFVLTLGILALVGYASKTNKRL